MLGLNQGIYEHFLWSRGDNSATRYWLLARRGLWEDVPDDSDKNKFQPSAWAECAGCPKTTNLHHHQEGSSGVEGIACKWWTCCRLAKSEKSSRCTRRRRMNFVGRWSTEATKTTIRLWSDSSGCKYFIGRRSFFGQRQGASGTFLQFCQRATRPPYERFLPRLSTLLGGGKGRPFLHGHPTLSRRGGGLRFVRVAVLW